MGFNSGFKGLTYFLVMLLGKERRRGSIHEASSVQEILTWLLNNTLSSVYYTYERTTDHLQLNFEAHVVPALLWRAWSHRCPLQNSNLGLSERTRSVDFIVKSALLEWINRFWILIFNICGVCGSQKQPRLLALFCITEVQSVYWAVRYESLYKTDTFHLHTGNIIRSHNRHNRIT